MRNLHAPQWGVAPTVFAVTVPIGAAADPESQTLGDLRESSFDGGGVARVPNLHAIESLILEDANLRLGAVIAQMRPDGEPAHLVHEGRDFGESGQRLLDVGGAATTQVPAERVADVFTDAAIDERARDVRPPQRPVVSANQLGLHVLELDVDTQALELGDHLLTPHAPRGTGIAQKFLEPLVAIREKQPKHVQLAPRGAHAEFAARNNADAQRGGFMCGVRDAVGGVVIGERDRGEPGGARVPRDVRRLALAVGCR